MAEVPDTVAKLLRALYSRRLQQPRLIEPDISNALARGENTPETLQPALGEPTVRNAGLSSSQATTEAPAVDRRIEGISRGRFSLRKTRTASPSVFLFDFCWFPRRSFDDVLDSIRRTAHREDWTYPGSDSKSSLPILRNYLIYTFARVKEEGKIAVLEDKSAAAFNTGLVTDKGKQICLRFAAAGPAGAGERAWKFYEVVTEDLRQFRDAFGVTPKRANFFTDHCMPWFYNPELPIDCSEVHILEERENRLPSALRGKENFPNREALFNTALQRAQQRAAQDYRIAVPQYYNGRVDLLLPLCIKHTDTPDAALVLERRQKRYVAPTVFDLEMAYRQARLIAPIPEDHWLQAERRKAPR